MYQALALSIRGLGRALFGFLSVRMAAQLLAPAICAHMLVLESYHISLDSSTQEGNQSTCREMVASLRNQAKPSDPVASGLPRREKTAPPRALIQIPLLTAVKLLVDSREIVLEKAAIDRVLKE